MKILSFAKALSLSLILTASTGASAATISSHDLDPLLATNNGNSDFGTISQRAARFTVGATDQDLGSISWLGLYTGNQANNVPATDNFTVRIFTEVGGAPSVSASVLDLDLSNTVTRIDTGTTGGNASIFDYQVNLNTGVTLTAGTNYWLSIVNNVGNIAQSAQDLGRDWAWTMSSNPGGFTGFRSLETDPWTLTNTNLQFQYELSTAPAAVPVPAALWLMLSGIAGLAAFKRKKQA